MRSTRSKPPSTSESFPLALFPDIDLGRGKKTRTYKRIHEAIWTHNKAHFVQQYLKYFVQITKHGAYIDGFSGPQSFLQLEAWSAALVLKSEPRWLRKFFLCEISRKGVKELKALAASQRDALDRKGRRLKRRIEVHHGDFNVMIRKILSKQCITQKEATFCLLDQRTFECHWSTLLKLARYKKPPNRKVELLYFLGVGWLHRALSGIRKDHKALQWWGRSDWRSLTEMNSFQIVQLVRERMEKELGYRYVGAYPVYDREAGNRVMYYMIHASDHDEAPALMVRAHSKAVRSLPSAVQSSFGFRADTGIGTQK